MSGTSFWRNVFWKETDDNLFSFEDYQLNSFGKKVLPWVLWFAKNVNAKKLLEWFLKMNDPELAPMFCYWNCNLPMWLVPKVYPNVQSDMELNILGSRYLTAEIFGNFFWSPDFQETLRNRWNMYYVPKTQKRIKRMFEWSIVLTDLNISFKEPISAPQQQFLASTIILTSPEIVVVEKFTDQEAINIIIKRVVRMFNTTNVKPSMGFIRAMSSLAINIATSKKNIDELIKINLPYYRNFSTELISRPLETLSDTAIVHLLEEQYIQMAYKIIGKSHSPNFDFRFLLMCEYFKPVDIVGSFRRNSNVFKEHIQENFGVNTWEEAVNLILKETGYGDSSKLPFGWKEELLYNDMKQLSGEAKTV